MILTKCILLLALISLSWADCLYWDGRAPYCRGSCPSGCVLQAISNKGNGATCWFGHKELCDCCGRSTPNHVCTPTITDMTCYGLIFGYGVAICKDKELQLDNTGHTIEKTCSAYICGACFGFWSERRPRLSRRNSDDDTLSCHKDNIFHISPMREDVFVRGQDNLTEHDIERMLVSRFGSKQSHHNMTIIVFDDIDASSRNVCK
ncbi:hypothetical protein F5H01DRAFT_415453 [Linnemannia elongata]|nr:hypothetical protein F5H01DRAFT_415453 [Linnemannia elongata]